MNEVVISNLSFSYDGQNQILKNIDLNLNTGEITVLAGPNGSGKTTLIKLIFDLLNIKDGSITIYDKAHKCAECKKKSIFLPGDNMLPEFLTGDEYIKFMCKLYEFNGDLKLLKHIISYYSMENSMDRLIESYSHGMKKKIQLIAAFYIQPDIIVIDETLNGIDLKAKEVSKTLIKNLVKKNKIILLCTHDLEFAAEIGERAILMYEGVIYKDILLSEIKGKTTFSLLFKEIMNFEDSFYEL